MGRDVIIACDFNSKEEVMQFLDKFQEEKPFVKIGMELFYAEGPEIVREIKRSSHIVSVLARKIVDAFAAKPLCELVFEKVTTAAMALNRFLVFPSASRTAPKLFVNRIIWVKPFIVNFFFATFKNVAAF